MSKIMLDLETMGNGPNAAIIAIGAVAFDELGISSRFYKQASLSSSVSLGLDCDPSTVMWWMQQSDEARSAFKDNEKAEHICGVLAQFATWFCEVEGEEVWGNGAAFDNVILANAYRKNSINPPWKFWNDGCYRTIKSMHPDIELERVGTHHNALDDAESQAIHLIKILDKLNKENSDGI